MLFDLARLFRQGILHRRLVQLRQKQKRAFTCDAPTKIRTYEREALKEAVGHLELMTTRTQTTQTTHWRCLVPL